MKNLAIYSINALLLISICQNSIAQQIFRGITCGSPIPFTSSHGDTFMADIEYDPIYGYGYQGDNMTVPIPNRFIGGYENLDSLYYTRREGNFSYLFDIPDGTYGVTLYLLEKTYHSYDFRRFSVCIDGDTLVRDLDIFERTGRSYGWPIRQLVECTDGQLNVDILPSIAEATLSGIAVRSLSPNTNPPHQILNFALIGGYEMNILYWDWIGVTDLAGYLVYRRVAGEPWEPLMTQVHPQYRYIDRDVEPGTEYEYMVTAVDHWGNESIPSDSLTADPEFNESTQLPRYIMDITEENLYLLNIDIWSDEYVDIDLTLEGEFYPDAGVRYRGSTTRERDKKNYKFKLPSGELHNGRWKFNLQSGMYDSSMMVVRLGYQSFDLLNCLNSFTQSIHLERVIQPEDYSEFMGVYLDIEQVDNYFLESNGLSPAGNLYKCEEPLYELNTYEEYQQFFIKENNEESDWWDIIDFIEWLNNSTIGEFQAEAGDRFAVDDYIDIYTILISIADYDFVIHNFYMYANPVDGRWYLIPWDHNECFDDRHLEINGGTQAAPICGFSNALVDKVQEAPLFRYSYCKKLERFLNNEYSILQVQAWIDTIYQEIEFDAIRDIYHIGWERPDFFINSREDLYNFIEFRVPYLLGQIPNYITNPPLAPYFRLNEIQSNNLTTIADEFGDYDPWIEIFNLAPVELDLTDFILHYGEESWILPAEAVVDDYGFLLIWLDGEPGEGPLHSSISLSPGSGAMWLEGRQGATADTVVFPALSEDQVWARGADGTGNWVGGLLPTPASTNTPFPDPSPLVINEFLAKNDSVNQDPAGDYDDWLEIYNPTDILIPLDGLYLTDDLTRPTHWAFPDTSIAPLGYILVWCDDEPVEGLMHATFKLSVNGEQIGLYHRDMETPIDTLTYSEQEADISYGRYPDGSENWMQLIYPSPGATNSLTAVHNHETPGIPTDFALDNNYPNPFNSTTVIRFAMPKSAVALLRVYDILGREVGTLKNEKLEAGYYSVIFDGSELSSGIYFYRFEAENFAATVKMLLLK